MSYEISLPQGQLHEIRQLRGRLRAFARRSPPITGSLESSLET